MAALSEWWARIGLGLAGLVVLTLVLASCGGGSSGPGAEGAPPKVERFELVSYDRIESGAAVDGGTDIYMVDDQDIVVRGHARGVNRVRVVVSLGARYNYDSASAVPDASGDFEMRLRLPELQRIYVIQGGAVCVDELRQFCPASNGRGEYMVSTGAFRVMAQP